MEYKLTLKNKNGLHARPASKLVGIANQYSSDIYIIFNNKEINAKSTLSLMQLGADQGSEIILRAVGKDEEDAIKRLTRFIEEELASNET